MNAQNSSAPATLNDRVKKAALFSVIGHGILIVLVLAILFLPVFSYTATADLTNTSGFLAAGLWEENVHDTNLVGDSTGEVEGDLLGGEYTYTDKGNFSYFDDVVLFASTMFQVVPELSEDEENASSATEVMSVAFASIMMIFVLILAVVMVVLAIKTIVKDIKVLQNPDAGVADRKYQIANPKPVKVDARGRKVADMSSVGYYVKTGGVLFVLDFVLVFVMNMFLGVGTGSGMTGVLLFLSRFAGHISGVAWGIAPVAVLVVGAIVVFVQLKKMNQNITNELTD